MRDEEREIQADLQATVEARRELGPAYETELVTSFVERIDAAVAQRVDAELAKRTDDDEDDGGSNFSFVVALVSLGTGIPITAVAGGTAELAGVVAAWAGIVGVNVAVALGQRGRRR